MTSVVICRVCLVRDLRMYSMQNTKLAETFEFISGNKLSLEDGKPETICYICYSQLQRCFKFREMTRTAESALTQFFENGHKLTEETSTLLFVDKPHNLSPTAIQHTSWSDDVEAVKEEQSDSTDYFVDIDDDLGACVKIEVAPSSKRSSEDAEDSIIESVLRINFSEIKTENNDINLKYEEGSVQNPADKKTNKNNSNKRETNYILNKERAQDGRNDLGLICCKCNKKHVTQKALDQHMKVHDINRSYVCEICQYRFNTSSNLKTHMENLHRTENETVVCTICHKQLNSPQILKRHMKIHSGKPHTCQICHKTFSVQYYLKRHMKLHTNEKPHFYYACSKCDKKYSSLAHMKYHMKMHSGEKGFSCDVCQKVFANSNHWKSHMKIHTGEKPHVCDICGKTFAQRSVLLKHVRTHTGEKPFACHLCGKTFSNSTHLRTHIRTHTGEKPFACENCGKAFSDNTGLKKHMRTHTGEKPYACTLCDRSFADYTNMKTHMVTHTGEKPFNCDRCGKTFTQQGTMKKHIQIVHLKERPYACDMCPKTYAKSQALKVHLRSHTGERPYNCDKCNKTFTRGEILKRHLKTHCEARYGAKCDKIMAD